MTDQEYRAVFDASPDGCLVVGRDGVIRGANQRVEELFGWRPEELVGRTIEVLVPEALRRVHEGHRAAFAADPHTRPMGVGLDLRARRRDGSTFPVEISLSPWQEPETPLRIVCTVRDVSEVRRLRDFSEGALRASEEERRRIARELHDDIAQRLAALILRVRRIASESDAVVRRSLGERVRDEVVSASEAVRLMARGLRPPELEEVGLALALQAHARRLREATGFEIDADLEAVGETLDLPAKLALYRIVQEAISNARRHSGQERVTVRLFDSQDGIEVEVEDSGRGFLPAADRGEEGLGLIGMQERATMIGARLTIESEPGRGTRVHVRVPTGEDRAETGP